MSGASRRRSNHGGGQRGCILVCEQPCDREVERGVVRRQSVEHPRSRRCGHADAAEGNVHGLEVLTMGLIDVAVAALLGAVPLPCAGAHGDADIGRDDRGSASRLVGSLPHPAARLGGYGRAASS